MGRMRTRIVATLAAATIASLAVAAGATAHGGRGGARLGGASLTALVTEGAKQLGVTAARLQTAIVNSAVARVDDAVADGDIEADDAAEYKSEARSNLRFAYAISRTRTVASNLGVTTTRLNTAFRTARRNVIGAAIDAALAAGRITSDQAATLKARLAAATLPGYRYGLGGYGR
jgi:hypothetical protein